MKKLNFTFGFTLAEILITLGIIGVVAAMTIPTLIANTQKQEFITAYKKTYSLLSQAFQQIGVDTECSGDMICTGLFDGTDTQTVSVNVAKALSQKLKIIQDCGWNGNGCFATERSLNSTSNWPVSGAEFITADGIAVSIFDLDGNCNAGILCATIYIDVNSTKKPNIYGRDAFLIYVNAKGFIIPHGGNNSWNTSSTDSGANCRTDAESYGWGCSGRIIEDGWQMKY